MRRVGRKIVVDADGFRVLVDRHGALQEQVGGKPRQIRLRVIFQNICGHRIDAVRPG